MQVLRSHIMDRAQEGEAMLLLQMQPGGRAFDAGTGLPSTTSHHCMRGRGRTGGQEDGGTEGRRDGGREGERSSVGYVKSCRIKQKEILNRGAGKLWSTDHDASFCCCC